MLGLAPGFQYNDSFSNGGFDLIALNHGALAPVDWQRKKFGSVIDYCLNDIALTKRLFERIRLTGGLRDPRDSTRFITMRRP